MIKKNWVYILFGISVLVFAGTRLFRKTESHKGMVHITGKTIHSDSLGWGYEIFVNNRRQITQNFIPGITGRKGFVSEEQASAIAQLVIRKMTAARTIPEITVHELDSCHITY